MDYRNNFFNFNKQGYSAEGCDWNGHTLVRVRAWRRRLLKTYLPSSSNPTPTELADAPEDHVPRGLIVGVTIAEAKYYSAKRATPRPGHIVPTRQAAEMRGKCLDDVSKPNILPRAKDMCRVVVPINAPELMCYYMLINPDKDGLCDTAQVPSHEVFFHREWRDDSIVGIEDRQNATARKIKSYLEGLFDTKPVPSSSPIQDPPTPPAINPTRIAAIMKLKSMALLYSCSPDQKVLLRRMQALLQDHFDIDLADRPTGEALLRLLEPEKPLLVSDMKCVHEDILTLWPDLRNAADQLDDSDLRAFGKAIRAVPVTIVPFAQARVTLLSFVRHYQIQLEDGNSRREARERSLKYAQEDADIFVGPVRASMLTVDNEDRHSVRMLTAIKLYLQQVTRRRRDRCSTVVAEGSGQVTAHNFDEIWTQFKNSEDNDTAHFWAGHAWRNAAYQLASVENESLDDLEKLIELLDSMARGLTKTTSRPSHYDENMDTV